jgi:uncharacterized membrane protein
MSPQLTLVVQSLDCLLGFFYIEHQGHILTDCLLVFYYIEHQGHILTDCLLVFYYIEHQGHILTTILYDILKIKITYR